MSMILKSGYLQLHESGLMARIVSSNGNATQFCVTKRQALEMGEAMVGIGVTEVEWKAIREQIHASPLLDKSKEIEQFACTIQGRMEELERAVEKIQNQMRRDREEGEDWKKGI